MSLIYPMFAMVVLTVIVLGVMFASRVRAVRSKDVSLGYFRIYSGAELPDYTAKPARHFTNLFEAPVLFYVACLSAMTLGLVGPTIVYIAWAYVILRYLHAFVHIGKNDIMIRMRVYGLSWVALLCLWLSIILGTI